MLQVLMRNWWALALRGVASLVFGLIAILFPGITIGALILLFAVYAVVDGVFAIIAGIRAAERHERWWPLALEGVIDILAGIVVFLWPALSLIVLIYIIAAWAVISGAALLGAAVRLRALRGDWLLAVNGVISVLLGVLLFLSPIAGAIVLAWWVGAYALLFGVLLIILAFQLRRWRAQPPGGLPPELSRAPGAPPLP
ncbi:MAG: HdeD family acid-resistance protein [Alphaproteobacteria bacterium]|nr:HdeD family acid-resistance protein [Alphaproteobacteria bacterium]